MAKKRSNIKEILASNLRENRRKRGLTQEKLAEMADISLRYIAMLELGKSFPSGEMLEKLSKALEIDAIQLFDISANQEGALQQLEKSIVSTIKQAVKEAVKETINDEGLVKK
jgi:transcriptional regulator with XRE-family HTH domain